MNLDPQIAELIDTLDAGFPPVHTMTGAEARATIRSRFVATAEPEPVGEVRDDVGARTGRRDRRADLPARRRRPLPVLVYAHGGGFVFCDLDSHDGLCRNLANLHSRRGRFGGLPAGAGTPLAGRRRGRLRGDPVGGRQRRCASAATRAAIVVGGDSAGGNLAAVAALMARDRGGPTLAAQLLLYPVIAADFDTESYRLFGHGFYNPRPALQWYWDQYVPAAADREHPYAVTAARRPATGCRPPSS